jgi:hypothetical protein
LPQALKGNAMNGQQPGQGNSQSAGNAQPDDASAAASVGHRTSGEAGATPAQETMAETGGSGGSGLTRNQPGRSQASGKDAARSRQGGKPAESDSVIDSGARGAQDTRSRQAGGTGTGLGSTETGANQTPADLDRQKGQ